MNEQDLYFLQEAFWQATQCTAEVAPNPKVGCVLVSSQNKIIGKGQTQQYGKAHAEVMALRQAKTLGEDTSGTSAYVTLEPCSHFGKTPPCCDALISAKVARVVVIHSDPNPLVMRQGIERLRASGIEVLVLQDIDPNNELLKKYKLLNAGFFSRMKKKKPWIKLKIAASLDGFTALPNGNSQWITGIDARVDAHRLRANACAVLTGVGTVIADNPQLNVRHVACIRHPIAIVIDHHSRTPPNAALIMAHHKTLIYDSKPLPSANYNAKVELIKSPQEKQSTRLDLSFVMQDLAKREINEVLVEAGATLNGALLAQGLVDEVILYLASKLLGSGSPLATLPPLTQVSQACELELLDIHQLNTDIRLQYLFKPQVIAL